MLSVTAKRDLLMETYEWTPQLSVGVKEIDEDHKILINLLNEAIDFTDNKENSAGAAKILEALIYYTQKHFLREEAVLEVCGYANLEQHKISHHHIVQEVKDKAEKLDKGTLIQDELVTFLLEWLVNHIADTDADYASICEGKSKLISKTLEPLPME